MKQYLQVFKKIKLFEGLDENEIFSVLGCLNAKVKTHAKDTVIFSEGGYAGSIGVILSGEVIVKKTDYDGNVNIISRLFPAELIGAVIAYSGEKRLPFDAVCACETEVLHLDRIKQCCKACAAHSKVTGNLLGIVADKNVQLTDKINILTKRSIREKLLAYLHLQAKKTKNKRFFVGLSRRQMAEYLSVDRSAMIRELSKMRDEGLLGFEDNIFWFN